MGFLSALMWTLKLIRRLLTWVSDDEEEICYLQSQNGNIYRYSGTHEDEEDPQPELATLQRIFHPHVSFMNEALGECRL